MPSRTQRSLRVTVVLGAVALAAACTSSPAAKPSPSAARYGFHLEYDVTDGRGVHSVEVNDVDRPYRARTLRYSLTDGTRSSVGGIAWSASGIYDLRPDGSVQEVSIAWPAAPGPDAHLDVALPVALRQHVVLRAASSVVLGTPCAQWRSLQPLDGASFALPTATEHTTSCVSADGLLLSDEWVRDGKRLRSRVAIARGPAPDLSGDGLLPATATPAPTAFSPFTVTESTQAELTRLLPVPDPAAPAGLRSDRAVAVLDVDRSGDSPRITREGAVLTWVGGGHLVEAKYGRDLTSSTPAPTGGAPVALGSLGSGQLTPVLHGLQVEVLGPRGLLLTVTSDLPEAQLLAWMRSLSF